MCLGKASPSYIECSLTFSPGANYVYLTSRFTFPSITAFFENVERLAENVTHGGEDRIEARW